MVRELLASLVDHLSVTDVVLLLGMAGVVLDRLADARGWSRSSKALRLENTDLLRRNHELETTVARHVTEGARLTAQVETLQARDQAAVLSALERHEVSAERRAATTSGLLTEIRDTLKGAS